MRLIDADALEPDAEYDDGEYWAYSRTQIENAPSIEPERKRGRWIVAGSEDGYWYKCSECGKWSDWEDPFCRECGAKMEEGDQE